MGPPSPKYSHLFVLYSVFLSLATAAVMPGCQASPRITQTNVDARVASVMTVRGDWNDVEAALLVSLQDAETAVLDQRATEVEQVFDLLGVEGEPGTLTATRAASEVGNKGPIPIRIECTIGLFGEPQREALLLEAMARRLARLAGVDYAPLD